MTGCPKCNSMVEAILEAEKTLRNLGKSNKELLIIAAKLRASMYPPFD